MFADNDVFNSKAVFSKVFDELGVISTSATITVAKDTVVTSTKSI